MQQDKRPLFTIVMPTRNRGELLRNSLQTALNQSFTDYEIVVCDNNSVDNTAQVVRELAHPRLRYVKSEVSLSMPDNWEYAWGHARGEYIMYLCDDDAYLLAPRKVRLNFELGTGARALHDIVSEISSKHI